MHLVIAVIVVCNPCHGVFHFVVFATMHLVICLVTVNYVIAVPLHFVIPVLAIFAILVTVYFVIFVTMHFVLNIISDRGSAITCCSQGGLMLLWINSAAVC